MNDYVVASRNDPTRTPGVASGYDSRPVCAECNSLVGPGGCTNPECEHHNSRDGALTQPALFPWS